MTKEITYQCSTSRCGGSSSCSGLFFGGALVLAGLAFLGGELGWLHGYRPIDFWPTLIIWMGLSRLPARRPVSGFFHILLGAALLSWTLNLIPLQWNVIWPVSLIALGLFIFVTGFCRRRKSPASSRPFSKDYFQADLLFSGQHRDIVSTAFEGGDIRCVMSGMELDMRSARMKDKEAILKIRITMGGLELRIPDNWEVELKGNPVLGGFEDKTRRLASPDQCEGRLILDTDILMGGIEIKN